jgi:hypothetical protein
VSPIVVSMKLDRVRRPGTRAATVGACGLEVTLNRSDIRRPRPGWEFDGFSETRLGSVPALISSTSLDLDAEHAGA